MIKNEFIYRTQHQQFIIILKTLFTNEKHKQRVVCCDSATHDKHKGIKSTMHSRRFAAMRELNEWAARERMQAIDASFVY